MMSFEAVEIVMAETYFLGMAVKYHAHAVTKDGREIELRYDADGFVVHVPERDVRHLSMECRSKRVGPDTVVVRKRIHA